MKAAQIGVGYNLKIVIINKAVTESVQIGKYGDGNQNGIVEGIMPAMGAPAGWRVILGD